MSNKEPYRGVPLRPCQRCGKLAKTWNYCQECSQKIHEEWVKWNQDQAKRKEQENKK